MVDEPPVLVARSGDGDLVAVADDPVVAVIHPIEEEKGVSRHSAATATEVIR
jgi:hypothetical protein